MIRVLLGAVLVFTFTASQATRESPAWAAKELRAGIIGTDTSGDPVISLPLYGGKHAKTSAADVVKLDTSTSTDEPGGRRDVMPGWGQGPTPAYTVIYTRKLHHERGR